MKLADIEIGKVYRTTSFGTMDSSPLLVDAKVQLGADGRFMGRKVWFVFGRKVRPRGIDDHNNRRDRGAGFALTQIVDLYAENGEEGLAKVRTDDLESITTEMRRHAVLDDAASSAGAIESFLSDLGISTHVSPGASGLEPTIKFTVTGVEQIDKLLQALACAKVGGL